MTTNPSDNSGRTAYLTDLENLAADLGLWAA